MHETTINRRRWLVAAIAFVGSAPGLRLGRVWAQNGPEALAGPVWVQMARRLFPHDSLPDTVYAQILDAALSDTAADGTFAQTFIEAEAALNAHQDADFADLNESGQLAALRAQETSAFFVAIQTAVRLRLYNHPAFWELVGYAGPSWQFGGYLNRGAGEIDWLAEVQ